MILSNRQKKEIRVIKYYMPSWCTFDEVTNQDIVTFFNWSDRGIPYVINEGNKLSGLGSLHYGKKYRDLHVNFYKEGWGESISALDLSEEPDFIVEYLCKALNKPAIDDFYRVRKNLEPTKDGVKRAKLVLAGLRYE